MIRCFLVVFVFMMMMSVRGGDPYQEAMQAGQKNEQGMKWADAAGNYNSATELVKDNGKKANALLRLAYCCRKQKKNDEAQKIYAQILGFSEINPAQRCQVQIGVGLMLMEEHKFIEAIVEFKKVTATNNAPAYQLIDAQLNIARSLFQLKSYDEAVAAYEKMLTMTPNPDQESIGRFDIGRCLLAQKKYDIAMDSFEKVVNIDNASLGMKNQAQDKIAEIAYYYNSHKDLDKAIAVYEKLLSMDLTPDKECNYNNSVASCFYEQEKYDAAVRACAKAFKVERATPANRARSQIVIGNSMTALKRYSQAVDAFEKAIDVGELTDSVQLAEVCFQMSRCYCNLKNNSKAKKELKKILDMDNATDDQKKVAKERLKDIDGGDHNKKRR